MHDLSSHNLKHIAFLENQLPPEQTMSKRDLLNAPQNELAREKILAALNPHSGEPFLTIAQIAQLFYSVRRDGQPARSTRIRPRKNEAYDLVPGYHSARAILTRMVDSGQLVVFRNRGDDTTPSLPNLYALKGTRKAINDRALYGHEMDAVDCFVALRKAFGERLVRWERRWDRDDWETFAKKWGLLPDATFELDGDDRVWFLEVDRGTEEPDQLLDKLGRYVRFSNAHPGERFHVLFTAQAYRYDREDMDRVKRLLCVFAGLKRGNQFAAATQEAFLADPDGAVLNSPLGCSFTDVKHPSRGGVKVESLGEAKRFLAL